MTRGTEGDEDDMTAQATAQIGVTGLGVMGRNLARNFARHGYPTALHNRTTARTDAIMADFGHEGTFVPAHTAEEFVASLERPRRLVIMVNAGAVDGVPCTTHVGPDGAGHFVKMVHNGIEYADMQLIAEAYDLLRHAGGYEPAQIAEIFRTWNTGRLASYLIEITAEVLAHTDAKTGRPFIDIVLDQAEQKGTGRWTVQVGLDLGVPVDGIAEATFARSLSGHADLRAAARQLPGPSRATVADPGAFADRVEQA